MNIGKDVPHENLLPRINSELKTFLDHSLNTDSFWEKWTAIDFGFKRVTCWEIKKCDKVECPSYRDADCRCWLRAGTLCGGEVQGDFAKKYRSCFDCDVFKTVESDPVRSLYENINIIIHNLRQRDEKIIETAIKDKLTGAYNRTYFHEYIQKLAAHSSRYGEPLSFIMIDLDGFKQLNDNFGHAAGDAVLVETAKLIISCIRSVDSLFRYGGDEFLIVLPHTDCERAEAIKLRLTDATELWNEKSKGYGDFRLSLSVGCHTMETGGDILTSIKKADSLMYIEKRMKKQ